jgi:amino acid transporter
MTITAAILAEICSALPLSGSIYIWAAESAGPDFARFFGFIVAWWSTTAWMTFIAGNCQVSRFVVWKISLIKGSCRQLQTILCLSLQSSRLISQEELIWGTSNGAHLFGLFLKGFSFSLF